MPRRPRLDMPGLVHHVMARGIEGRDLFRDDDDREGFLKRLADGVGRPGGAAAVCLGFDVESFPSAAARRRRLSVADDAPVDDRARRDLQLAAQTPGASVSKPGQKYRGR